MIDTKLILLEGPPGSGKTTTAMKIAESVKRAGVPCQCFWEWSRDHPIAIGDDLHLDEVIRTSIAREEEVLRQWQQFAQVQQGSERVTVMESRFWQTSVMLMYIAGSPVEKVMESNARVVQALLPLKPVFISYRLSDLGALVERTVRVKNGEWERDGLPGGWDEHVYDAFATQPWFTTRGLGGPAGMAAFLEDWRGVADQLYARLPFPKVEIRDPQEDWGQTMQRIEEFLEI